MKKFIIGFIVSLISATTAGAILPAGLWLDNQFNKRVVSAEDFFSGVHEHGVNWWSFGLLFVVAFLLVSVVQAAKHNND